MQIQDWIETTEHAESSRRKAERRREKASRGRRARLRGLVLLTPVGLAGIAIEVVETTSETPTPWKVVVGVVLITMWLAMFLEGPWESN